MDVRWTAVPVPPAAAALRAAGLASPLAELLAQRGFGSSEAARAFLAPARRDLSAAGAIGGAPAAAVRLAEAAERRERILVVGDYDVDGVTATALASSVLAALGGEVSTLLPRRDAEGYGLQPRHVRHAVAVGAKLLVSVDSGTTAYAAWEEARRLGVELVVVDHHLGAESEAAARPEAPLLVHPRLPGTPAAAAGLTAAGLCARLGELVFDLAGREAPWESLARLACLGTIADVAPLVGDNRILAAAGLAALPGTPSPGLRALLRAAAVREPLSAADVAFRIAPRLNAAGRLGSADDALELVMTRDARRARELAEKLERANAERQAIERRILADARRALERRSEIPPIVVLSDPEWHVGVVGVAAARLAREVHRPVLLLAERGGEATGSGRSVAGLPLHELVAPLAPSLERFGGHAQAIGVTVRVERLAELRAGLEHAAGAWSERLALREQRYDLALALDAVEPGLPAALAALGPFGAGNPEPVFRFGPCSVAGAPETFGNGHLRFAVFGPQDGRPRRVVWWRGAGGRPVARERPIELLASVETDRYDGVRLRLLDQRSAGSASD